MRPAGVTKEHTVQGFSKGRPSGGGRFSKLAGYPQTKDTKIKQTVEIFQVVKLRREKNHRALQSQIRTIKQQQRQQKNRDIMIKKEKYGMVT
jgi:NCAIR mutase (PurE)-related protein